MSGAWQRATTDPPWPVRLVGAVIVLGDTYLWLYEATPVTPLELAKHGLLLAVGLACLYPEGLRLVGNTARRLPFFDRRLVIRRKKGPP